MMIKTALSVGLASLLMSAPAIAQQAGPYRGTYPNPAYEGRSGFGSPPPYCQKLCTQDVTPCDPPEYKRADGRCNDPLNRF